MNAKEKIARCTTRLLLARPWWASLLLQLNVREADPRQVPTMGTDGKNLYYSAAFTDKLSMEECEGVLCHEVGHCALLHMTRRGNRDPERWNIAADAVVNAMLLADGITLPPDCVPPAPLDLTAEDVYSQTGQGAKMPAALRDLLESASDAERAQMETKWQQAVAQAAGLLPKSIARQVEEATEAKVPWQEVVAQFVQNYRKSDRVTWMRESRRIDDMPGRRREPEIKLALIVDTSGSISPAILGQFIPEMKYILALNGVTAYIMASDAEVGMVVEPGEEFPASFPGGGGTDFRPALKHVEELPDVAAAIYLTDGEGTFPADCQVPVLWALTTKVVPPFGTSIYLQEC